MGAVFISYCSQDAPAAERVCEALRAVGIDVWLDKNELRGGDAWDAQIKKRIHECALFIPIISAHTNARSEGYFRGEWHLATRRLHNMADDAAFLVPVVVDGTREADARVPEEFFRAQWTWLPGGETPPALAERVRQLLGLDPAPISTTKAAAAGGVDRSARSPGSTQASGLPLVRRFAIPLLVLLVVLGGGVFWYFEGRSDAPAVKPARSAVSPVVAVTPNDKSIAVLPFVDMSAEKNQEYMSDGIAEELLNLLAQVSDLKVIARTSSFAFKGQSINIAEIAKKLNVAHVLEGSVRTSGNTLRITAQLIRAADSTHLWSERYDRPMDDIFTVQDEIANSIVQALQVRLAGGEASRRKGGTPNLEAYKLYLRGTSALNQNTRESLDAAVGYLDQAIKLDPGYGMAWYALATVISMKTDNVWLDPEEGWERVRELAQHSLKLSPDLAEAHARLQWTYMSWDWDWQAAEAEGRRALAIDPTNPGALMAAGRLSATLGRWADSDRQLRAALVRDPLNTYVIWNLGFSYYRAGRFAESESLYRKLLELEPSFLWTRSYLAKTLVAQGKSDEALAVLQQDADLATRLWFLPIVLQAAGHQAEADQALQAQIAQWAETGAFFVAMTYAYRGDRDSALDWLERAYQQKDASLDEIVGEPLFKNLGNDPRFKAFLRKMKLPEE